LPTKEDLLWDLKVKELRKLAKENRVPLVKRGWLGDTYATTKEDIIEILLESSRITKKKILAILEPPKPKRARKKSEKKEVKVEEEHIKEKITTEREISRRIVTAREVTLKLVLDEVNEFNKRTPKIRGKRKEKLYTTALTSFLMHTFPSVKMEQALGKGSRIDAIIGNIGIEAKYRPDIGIEAKYRPDQNEINRLFGQIDIYIQFLNDIIVVFFDTDSGTVNNFKRKLKRVPGYTETVNVVNI